MKNYFWKNTSGGTAINFAIASTALFIAIGAATDLSLLTSEKSKLQDWADSTALAAAVSGETESSEFQSFAETFMDSSPFPDARVTTTINEGNLRVGLSQDKELGMLSAFGQDAKELYAEAEVPLPGNLSANNGGKNYNISLVLDTTHSMLARQKLDALKTAATDFLTDMDNNASPASMVGLVPFSTYVKLPTSYKDETWLEAPANWEGCMNSRRDGFHKTPDFENRRLQGFTQDNECGELLNSEVMPLTSDIDAVKASVQDMFPKGATYIPAGLIWGWRMLSPNAPMVEAGQNSGAERVLILLTDGTNTNSLDNNPGNTKGIFHTQNGSITKSQATANTLTAELCTSIKAEGIRVITIPFELYNSSAINLLENCASSPEDFHRANNNGALLNVFQEIEADLNEEKEDVVRLVR